MFHSYAKLIGVVNDADGTRAQRFEVVRFINSGGFGQVFEARFGGVNVAVKKIKRKRSTSSPGMTRVQIADEIKYIQQLRHPNILKFVDAFRTEDTLSFWIVTELCSGGELFDALAANKFDSEFAVAHVVRDIAQAIRYMHEQGIVHRDIKPENVLLQRPWHGDDVPRAKVIDFGLATVCTPGQRLQKRLGTPWYMSPELFKKDYTETCDEWALGVIVYMMFEGYWPFGEPDSTPQEVYTIIKTKTKTKTKTGYFDTYFDTGEFDWSSRPPYVRDFVARLLDPNGDTRMTARQALDHEMLTTLTEFESRPENGAGNIDSAVVKFRLRDYVSSNKIKRLLRFKIAQELTFSDKRRYEREFGDGIRSMTREQAAAKLREYLFSDAEIETLFAHLDVTGNGKWDVAEFIAALMSEELYNTFGAFTRAFSALDTNDNDELDVGELAAVVGEDDARAILSEFGNAETISKSELMQYLERNLQAYVEPTHGSAVAASNADENQTETEQLSCIMQ